MAFATNDLNDIVHSAIESLQSKIDAESVEVACDFDFPAVVCDRVQITEIFTNLINNAIKYNDDERKRVKIESHHDAGGELVLTVSDNGIGIEPDHYDSVFKIFKRLHAKDSYGGGTGTGLTIAAKIVERHGGRIWVEPGQPRGTRFAFTLPSQAHG
jgi:signal transduction histidine kinase